MSDGLVIGTQGISHRDDMVLRALVRLLDGGINIRARFSEQLEECNVVFVPGNWPYRFPAPCITVGVKDPAKPDPSPDSACDLTVSTPLRMTNVIAVLQSATQRMHNVSQLRRIVVGVDPAVSSNELSDETGIVVCGIGYDDHVYILDDCSVTSATPDQWAQAVVDAYNKWEADAVIAEVNQGGDMVETVILQKSRNLRVIKVRATKGKEVRAEPVAAIYERRECSHIGRFDKLEQQMTEWDPVNSVFPTSVGCFLGPIALYCADRVFPTSVGVFLKWKLQKFIR